MHRKIVKYALKILQKCGKKKMVFPKLLRLLF